MTKSIDPFEEYLRRKKVELMEQKLRDPSATQPVGEETEELLQPDEDPENHARLKEEMNDFFESGQTAGAELFNQMKGFEEEKVEEIKDALDDVFEEDAAVPKTDGDDNNFVEFFQQVEDEFDGEGRPVVSDAPVPPPVPPKRSRVSDNPPVVARPKRDRVTLDVKGPGQLEVSSEPAAEADPVDVETLREEGRLNLAEILLDEKNGANLEQRIEVLCRIVSRLVEKARLPESEIIEALIRADVEF